MGYTLPAVLFFQTHTPTRALAHANHEWCISSRFRAVESIALESVDLGLSHVGELVDAYLEPATRNRRSSRQLGSRVESIVNNESVLLVDIRRVWVGIVGEDLRQLRVIDGAAFGQLCGRVRLNTAMKFDGRFGSRNRGRSTTFE
jgi:hypothetical protein